MEMEDIVTLVPRFVITPGEPPVRDPQEASTPESDVGETLLPADVEPYAPDRPMPARSMLRRLPQKAH